MKSPTFGSDPEVMIVDNERARRIVSAIPVLKRDKHNPHILNGDLKLYSDNVLVEFSHPPVNSSEEAVTKFRSYLGTIKDFMGKRYSIHAQAAHHYPISELGKSKKNELGEELNPAWKAGCEDSFSPYSDGPNPKVSFRDELRTGSFHVHIGHDGLDSLEKKTDFVKLLDIYLGCSSIVFDRDQSNSVRREYYGRAGEFRCTGYGIEYRVLGNYALRHPELVRLVFDIANYCCGHLDKGDVKSILAIKGIQMHAQFAINHNYPTGAYKVLDAAGLPAMLVKRVTDTYKIPSMDVAWGLS